MNVQSECILWLVMFLSLKCFRLQGIAALFLRRNDAIVLAHCRCVSNQSDEKKIPMELLVGGFKDLVSGATWEDFADCSADVPAHYFINVRRTPPHARHTPGPSSLYGLMVPYSAAHVPCLCGFSVGGHYIPKGSVSHCYKSNLKNSRMYSGRLCQMC